jgi:hypothetical protein
MLMLTSVEQVLKRDHLVVVKVLQVVVMVLGEHGATVLPQVLVAVLLVFMLIMVTQCLALAAVAAAVDQVVVSTVVELLMVAMLVEIIEVLAMVFKRLLML